MSKFLDYYRPLVSILRQIGSLFSVKVRRVVHFYLVLHISLVLLDLVAIALIGVMTSLTLSGISSKAPSGLVLDILSFLRLSEFSFEGQVLFISAVSMLLLMSKSILAGVISRKEITFLANQSAELSSRVLEQFLNQPISVVKKFSSQKLSFALSTGSERSLTNLFSGLIVLISDLVSVLLILAGLCLMSPSIAISTVLVFSMVLIILLRQTLHRMNYWARNATDLMIRDSELVSEHLFGYRETLVSGRRAHYIRESLVLKKDLAKYTAELAWLPNLSKYILEVTFAFAIFVVSGFQFLLFDSRQAFVGISIFLVSSSRIVPALLRVQQGITSIQYGVTASQPLREIIAEIQFPQPYSSTTDEFESNRIEFSPVITFDKVEFCYPESSRPAISEITFQTPPNKVVAIAGLSGSGKSTLVDLLLGVLIPSRGAIQLSGYSPLKAIAKWPGKIGYAPQEVFLRSGSIAENLLMGRPRDPAMDRQIQRLLAQVKLDKWVAALPNGIDTLVGERGANMSLGQRQRIGIARALVTSPTLLVLDEATSSLDTETESAILDMIEDLRKEMTIVIIAHNFKLVERADIVLFLQDGRLDSQGSFSQVRKESLSFDLLAKLNGI